jgi:hypothetical protein
MRCLSIFLHVFYFISVPIVVVFTIEVTLLVQFIPRYCIYFAHIINETDYSVWWLSEAGDENGNIVEWGIFCGRYIFTVSWLGWYFHRHMYYSELITVCTQSECNSLYINYIRKIIINSQSLLFLFSTYPIYTSNNKVFWKCLLWNYKINHYLVQS